MIPDGLIGSNTKGVVFNIQRYSIHDGPGIRTTVFLKGCPLRCFWCQNPESQKRKPEVFLDKSRCTLCGQCVATCPTGASSLSETSSLIDRYACIGCGKCVEVCPNEARSLVGKYMTAGEVMQQVQKDKKFYENSGGGVTLSGGEPTAQPRFACAILKTCKEAGLHTVLDTCGYVPWQTMEKLLGYVDLVLYDIKCIQERTHREATGKSNRIILENAKRVAQCKAIMVRVPIIPGFNDSAEQIGAISHFVKAELGSVDIELLPYSKMGEIKYERLDRACVHLSEIGERALQDLATVAKLELGESKELIDKRG
jgi:pyruvate formate lyase activating enzyme